jgi:AraC family transcriptional regulator
MDEQTGVKPAGPRFENGHFLLIAGLGGRFTAQTTKAIPDLWEKFIPEIGNIPGQKSEVTYGICCNPPDKYRWVEVQPQHYAVFEHKGALDALPQTFQYIWKTWLPQSGYHAADAPEFERYSEDFNPKLNTGVLEIWLPLKA